MPNFNYLLSKGCQYTVGRSIRGEINEN